MEALKAGGLGQKKVPVAVVVQTSLVPHAVV